MPVIRIDNFGGELPSLSPRALPAGAAQVAQDLYARTTEFRPLAADTAVATSAIAGPATLFRMERKADGGINDNPANGWLTYAGVVSHARGQVADENTGRTYYTFDDGSAPPRVRDAVSVNKPLGIPAPAKPSIGVIVGDEFTPEDFARLMKTKRDEIVGVGRVLLAYRPIGYDMTTKPGYISAPASGVIVSTTITGGTSTSVTDPNNVGGPLIPSPSTTGGTVTTTTNDFVTVGGPVVPNTLQELAVLTLQHGIGFSEFGTYGGMVAQIPVAGGGATGFIRLYDYRTFSWDGFTYDTKQFYEWMVANGLRYVPPKG